MTTTDFDFDTLKAGLQRLDARLALHDRLQWQHERQRGIARLQWGLWPLWLGQALQMLFGLACIALGMAVWTQLRDGSALFVSAIAVHAYGVLCIVLAGITFGRMAQLDRSEPLTRCQLRLSRLRRFYIASGMMVGLSWWLFWMPFVATLFFWLTGGQVDFFARMGVAIPVMVAVGIIGLLATAWFHRWSRDPARPHLAKAMDDAVTGRSLAQARQRLDALHAFQHED